MRDKKLLVLLAMSIFMALPAQVSGEGSRFSYRFSAVSADQIFDAAQVIANRYTGIYTIQNIDAESRRLNLFVDYYSTELIVTITSVAEMVTLFDIEASGSQANSRDETIKTFVLFLEGEVKTLQENNLQGVRIDNFAALRNSLIGKNVRARISLPAWSQGGELLRFPPGRNVKPTEIATITEVLLCFEYPVAEMSCSETSRRARTILVLLFNGAQPRPKPPAARQVVLSGTGEGRATIVWESIICLFGTVLDCMSTQQRQQMRLQERAMQTTVRESRQDRLDTERREAERAYKDAGPEIAIWLDVFANQDGKIVLTHKQMTDLIGRFVSVVDSEQ